MRSLLSLALVLILSPAVFAADYRGECSISFQGSSTLHDFHGKGKCQPFVASSRDGSLDLSRVTVAVADLDTDNKKRDRKMREMFEEERFPLITGSALPVSLNDLRGAQKGMEGARVTLQLKIRDIVRPVTGTVTNLVQGDTRITADLAFTLSLAEYQLKPPSVIGLIKVADQVKVTATVVLDAE